ncbi:MAG: NUDIX domain-containing protein, partial [Spirochaetales bacterium]
AAGDRAAGRLLFIRRNRNPGKGLLDLPGGFVDPAESAETAIRREIKEELGAALRDLRYFGSYPNRYFYNEVWYNTCDLYFTAGLESGALMLNTEEIAGIEYISPEEYAAPGFPENIAFDSAKAALRDFAAGQYPADGLNRQNSC